MKREHALVVNGEAMAFAEGKFPKTVAELVAAMGLDTGMVVAEVNGDLVKRDDAPNRGLAPGDSVELVKLVGGG